MRKILNYAYMLMILALGVCTTTSCGGDDDNKEESQIVDDDTSLSLNGTSWIADDMDDNAIAYIIFNLDGTGKRSDTHVPDDFWNFKYILSGNTLRIKDTDYSGAVWEEYKILTFTKNKLVLQYTDTYGDTQIEYFHSI